jgi:hypothetical protein
MWENLAHYVYFGLLFCQCLSTTKVKIALLLQMAKRKVVLRFLVNDFIFFMDSKCRNQCGENARYASSSH